MALAAKTGAPRAAPVSLDADRQVCAKYYVQQILNQDEDSIKTAWNKVTRGGEGGREGCTCPRAAAPVRAFSRLCTACPCRLSGFRHFASLTLSLDAAPHNPTATTATPKNTYTQVSRTNRDDMQAERDARMEYLSWRVWGMKRKRAATARAVARAAAARRSGNFSSGGGGEDDAYADSEERAAALTNLYLDDLDAAFNAEVRAGGARRAGGGGFVGLAV